MKIIKLALVILLLLMPFGEIARLDLGNGSILLLNDFLVGITILISGVFLLKQKHILENRINQLLFLFAGIGFISLLINSRLLNPHEFTVSLSYLLRFVCYALLFVLVQQLHISFKKKIIPVLVVSGFIIVILGYIQYFFYANLRNLYYLGWDEHLYRMFSVFFDPNFAGAFFLLYFFLLFELVRGNCTYRFLNKYVLISFLFLTFVAIVLSYSRSAYIMLGAGLIVLDIIYSSTTSVGKYKKIIFVILGIGVFLTVIFLSSFVRSEGTNLIRTTSGNARIGAMQNALIIIANNPIIGVGFNAYRYAQYRYKLLDPVKESANHAGAGTDNSLLFVFATTGFLGFIVYSTLWIFMFKAMYQTRLFAKDIFTKVISAVAMASIVGIFINSFFINSLFYPFLMEWLFVVCGLALSAKPTENT